MRKKVSGMRQKDESLSALTKRIRLLWPLPVPREVPEARSRSWTRGGELHKAQKKLESKGGTLANSLRDSHRLEIRKQREGAAHKGARKELLQVAWKSAIPPASKV